MGSGVSRSVTGTSRVLALPRPLALQHQFPRNQAFSCIFCLLFNMEGEVVQGSQVLSLLSQVIY